MKTSKYTTQKIAMAGIAAICLATAAMGAHADEAAVKTHTVRYADLNLNTAAGAAVLYQRIKNAAEQVCGDVNSRQLGEAMAAKACVGHAIYASVHSVNNVQLSREYDAQMGAAHGSINVASLR
jgi:UrcA family protein